MDQEGYPQDPTFRALYKRLGTAFSDVKDNMAPMLADELADFTFDKMMSMTLEPDVARDITRCPAYHTLKRASASGVSINFPDWFFLATVYGPDHTALKPYHD